MTPEFKPQNLFDQTTSHSRDILATLIGADANNPTFRNNLRDIEVLPYGWTYGDAARAYGMLIVKQCKTARTGKACK